MAQTADDDTKKELLAPTLGPCLKISGLSIGVRRRLNSFLPRVIARLGISRA